MDITEYNKYIDLFHDKFWSTTIVIELNIHI